MTIVYVEIPAKKVKKLQAFYARCFGWRFKNSGMLAMDAHLIETGPRGKSVGDGRHDRRGPNDGPKNFIAVDTIYPTIRTFKSAGRSEIVARVEVPGMGSSCLGSDAEENTIARWGATRPTAARRRSSPKKA